MRILYVTKESPLQPAGGIGTYVAYIAEAMQALGHEVYLFTWVDTKEYRAIVNAAPFKNDHVRIERVDRDQVWRQTPIKEYALSLAVYLRDKILEVAREWKVDVIEATDFLAPALPLFQTLQTRAEGKKILCVTYNHGFTGDFHDADQIGMTPWEQTELLGERQQCRISDVVVAPSQAARARLATYGIRDHVSVVREPYKMESRAEIKTIRHDLTYFGRISISKGIDKVIHFANVTHEVHDWRQIKLVGRIVHTPFREQDMRRYVRARLSQTLREVCHFTDFLPRERALRLLEPGAICPSLGSADTFSYACVEGIDHGLLPVVRAGTPMAEFIPQAHRDIVLDENMRSVREIQTTFARLLEKSDEVMRDTRAFCEETLDPARIASEMTELYARKLEEKQGRRIARHRPRMGLEDVTVLMPVQNPTRQFTETIDSLALQTVGLPRTIIVNDGTPEARSEWFAYAETILPDAQVIDQPNTGLLGARNTLIEAAESPLSLFLDSDDILHPRALELLLQAWNDGTFEVDAVLPQRLNFDEASAPIVRDLLGDHLHILENDYRMTALVRTEVLREIGFDASRRNGEADDWVFWLDFAGRGYRGIVLPEQVFYYRFREGSMSWPWSVGQTIGTQAMVRDVVARTYSRDPQQAQLLARALYARAVHVTEHHVPETIDSE